MIGRYVRGAVHPLGGAQLGERLGVVAGGVRRLAAPPRGPRRCRERPGPRGQRVLVGRLRVLVDRACPAAARCRATRAASFSGRPLSWPVTDRSSSRPVISSGRSGPSYLAWSVVRGPCWSAGRFQSLLRPGTVARRQREVAAAGRRRAGRSRGARRPTRRGTPARGRTAASRGPTGDLRSRAGRWLRRSSATTVHLSTYAARLGRK